MLSGAVAAGGGFYPPTRLPRASGWTPSRARRAHRPRGPELLPSAPHRTPREPSVDPDTTSVAAQVQSALRPLLDELPGLDGTDLDTLAHDAARFCAALRDLHETRVNLTGVREPEAMARLHIVDSLLALPVLGDGPLVDLGSGGGLPGIPLALARPDVEVVLLESRARKAEALAELVSMVGLGPRVRAERARGEVWLGKHPAGTLLTRAVGAVARQLELLAPVRKRIGRLVMLKGPGAADELAEARPRLERQGWREPEVHELGVPGGDERRVLLVFAGGRRARA